MSVTSDFFFFFQAEDGIRDATVTGVQTCALPISPAVTRTSMLLVAAFALLGLWRLARDVANEPVAVATVLCTALYPVFFAQSSLAQLDIMAAALTFWGLVMYVERRPVGTIVFFALAPLAK